MGALLPRLVGLATLSAMLLALQAKPLFACQGETTIFQDEFLDDSGGWTIQPPAIRVEDSSLIVVAPPGRVLKSLNIANPVTTADICVEVTFLDAPASRVAGGAGLMFWAVDYNNYYVLQIQTNGAAGIWRYQNGTWLMLRPNTIDANVKTGQGAVNILRVRAAEKLVSLFINDSEIREIRGEPPTPNWHFGVYATAANDKPMTAAFRHVKVTTKD